MLIQEIYELAFKMGMDNDLRGLEKVRKYLNRIGEKYSKLSEQEKGDFDKEKLSNPYSDTRILFHGSGSEVRKVLAGIDIGGSELLLAKNLNIDLVISHHPSGKALADLHNVMDLQSTVLAGYGVPINIAESVLKPRIAEVGRRVHPANHNRERDFAKLLDLNFMCVHTPADNLGAMFISKLIEDKKPEYVGDLVDLLLSVPEYKNAKQENAGPKIFSGSLENSCGKIAVSEFTGGTEGAKEIYEKMANAGIGTIVGMHVSEDHRKEAEKYHLNVVIAGHISSDSLGMNLFLDELENRGVEIVTCSGLDRVKRKVVNFM